MSPLGNLLGDTALAMSEQNLSVVRRIYEAWAEGRSAAPLIERDLEYVNPPDAVEPGT